MWSPGDVLREVMLETGTTQSELLWVSGVRQPSISGFFSGRVELSDHQLDRLLSCMGRAPRALGRPATRPACSGEVTRRYRFPPRLPMRLEGRLAVLAITTALVTACGREPSEGSEGKASADAAETPQTRVVAIAPDGGVAEFTDFFVTCRPSEDEQPPAQIVFAFPTSATPTPHRGVRQ